MALNVINCLQFLKVHYNALTCLQHHDTLFVKYNYILLLNVKWGYLDLRVSFFSEMWPSCSPDFLFWHTCLNVLERLHSEFYAL